MLTRLHARQESELLKWFVLLVLASALALSFASSIAGGAELRPDDKPALLPDAITEWSSPMPDEQEETPDVAMEVWKAIDAQHHEEYEEAITAWKEVRLPADTQVWKYVALGQAYLATDQMDSAERVLRLAKELRPDNALVNYYVGLLRLEQAVTAEEWHDAIEPNGTVLIVYRPPRVAPNTKSMYELEAAMEFEAAIKNSTDLWLEERLVPADWVTEAAMEPLVSDLVLAMGAENFVPKSHNILGSLYLAKGSLELAEEHMDEAVTGGESVLYGYTELAEEYAADERHGDALRAYLKASQAEPDKMPPLRKAWESLKRAIF